MNFANFDDHNGDSWFYLRAETSSFVTSVSVNKKKKIAWTFIDHNIVNYAVETLPWNSTLAKLSYNAKKYA